MPMHAWQRETVEAKGQDMVRIPGRGAVDSSYNGSDTGIRGRRHDRSDQPTVHSCKLTVSIPLINRNQLKFKRYTNLLFPLNSGYQGYTSKTALQFNYPNRPLKSEWRLWTLLNPPPPQTSSSRLQRIDDDLLIISR